MKNLFLAFSVFIVLPIVFFSIYKLIILLLNDLSNIFEVAVFSFGIILYIIIVFGIFLLFNKCLKKLKNNESLEYNFYIYYISIAILYCFGLRLFNL